MSRGGGERSLVERACATLSSGDLGAFGALSSDDVRRGAEDHPRACRNLGDVLGSFAKILARGAEGRVIDVVAEPGGILWEFALTRPTRRSPGNETRFVRVYLVHDGRIVEIQRYDGRSTGACAVGLT